MASIGRIDIFNGNPEGGGLILHKCLELTKRPPVQSGADPLAGFYVVPNIREVLQNNRVGTVIYCFSYNLFACFVVDMFDAPPLFAGDLAKLLFRALRAVGLQAAAQAEMLVAFVSEVAPTIDFSGGRGGQVVFSDINTDDNVGVKRFGSLYFDGEVEVPCSIASDKVSFGVFSLFPHRFLKIANNHGRLDPAGESVKGKAAFGKAECSGAVVDRLSLVRNFRDVVFGNFPKLFKSFVGAADRPNGVAYHLRSEAGLFAYLIIGKLVQPKLIPATVFNHMRHQHIASIGICCLSIGKCFVLFRRGLQFYGDGTLHYLRLLTCSARSIYFWIVAALTSPAVPT